MSNPLDSYLSAVSEKAAKATPQQWHFRSLDGGWDGIKDDSGREIAALILNHPDNAAFIAAARQDIPKLLRLLRHEMETNDRLSVMHLSGKSRLRYYEQRRAELAKLANEP